MLQNSNDFLDQMASLADQLNQMENQRKNKSRELKKIWIVGSNHYEGWDIEGIYATSELAENRVRLFDNKKLLSEDYQFVYHLDRRDIESWGIDGSAVWIEGPVTPMPIRRLYAPNLARNMLIAVRIIHYVKMLTA